MKLTVTPQEYQYLLTLSSEAKRCKDAHDQALHDFAVAFTASMRARGIEEATFVSLSPTELEVTDVPQPLPQEG